MQFSRTIGRSLALIMLGGVLFVVAPANRATTVPLPAPSPTVSPTPVPTPEVKRPNPVRRFFSAVFDVVTGVFRRPKPFYCRLPPVIDLTSSSSSIAVCPLGQHSESPSCSSSGEVTLIASVASPQNNELLFTWDVTAGRLSSEGRKVTWNLNGVKPGTYTATVEVNDGNQHTANASLSVTVAACTDCGTWESPCPTIWVSCPSGADSKLPLVFDATVSGGYTDMKPTYTWSVTAGKITSGQGTTKITVDTSNLGGQSITATVTVGGYDPRCINTASCTVLDVLPTSSH